MAIITHAGGPAVMLTDALAENGMEVPPIDNVHAGKLLAELHPGSSVANPIDFLATGTASQLGTIIDYCDRKFDEVDAMAVIFGTPGLFPIDDVYEVLDEKMRISAKPIYPILPSTLTAEREIRSFIERGWVVFSDEVVFGKALARVMNVAPPALQHPELPAIDTVAVRRVIDTCQGGYIEAGQIQALLDAAGIPRIPEVLATGADEAAEAAAALGYPVVMKAVGPLHKSDVGGVILNISDETKARKAFRTIMAIEGTHAVLIQPMVSGIELFAGARQEPKFGHLIMCGMGGIFIETLRDVSAGLCPIAREEALGMIRKLKSYKIIQGVRGQKGVDEEVFAEVITRLSALLIAAPEISEMDMNPLIGSGNSVIAVDARIHVDKS
jgi:acetate---CoA ligase (ADP-forming)